MRMAALVIAKCVGVVAAKHFKDLLSVDHMYLRDAARARLTVCYHGLPIGIRMQVVMGIGTPGCDMICLPINGSIGGTPAAKALRVILPAAAVKTNPLSICAPEFVLVPFPLALTWNGSADLVCDIENPHAIRRGAVLMTKQNKIRIVRMKVHMIDPELLFAQHCLCLSGDRIHT